MVQPPPTWIAGWLRGACLVLLVLLSAQPAEGAAAARTAPPPTVEAVDPGAPSDGEGEPEAPAAPQSTLRFTVTGTGAAGVAIAVLGDGFVASGVTNGEGSLDLPVPPSRPARLRVQGHEIGEIATPALDMIGGYKLRWPTPYELLFVQMGPDSRIPDEATRVPRPHEDLRIVPIEPLGEPHVVRTDASGVAVLDRIDIGQVFAVTWLPPLSGEGEAHTWTQTIRHQYGAGGVIAFHAWQLELEVLFETGKASFRKTDGARVTAYLDELAKELTAYFAKHPEMQGEIRGHTDDTGDAAANQKLSERRAETVRAYLTRQGVPADSLVAVGFGEEQPRPTAPGEDARAANRRVELHMRAR